MKFTLRFLPAESILFNKIRNRKHGQSMDLLFIYFLWSEHEESDPDEESGAEVLLNTLNHLKKTKTKNKWTNSSIAAKAKRVTIGEVQVKHEGHTDTTTT